MNARLLTITHADLEPDDLVLLDDGDRYVFNVHVFPTSDHVTIEWKDGSKSTWLANGFVQVVRR